ncbi:MAG: ribbon-helix-helix domain-containing protein [Candidatus Hermodarchaeia archaeon]
MKLVTAQLPENLVDGVDELVNKKMYQSRSAAIRVAVRDLLRNVLWSDGFQV